MTAWLLGIVYSWGYAGIFLLLALARLIPPIPSETVIPLAGLGTAGGDWNLLGLALAGGLGSTAGQLVWYMPNRLWEPDRLERFLHRHGHWLTVKPQRVERTTAWFRRRGWLAVLGAQPIPGLRTLVAIPAGACRMPVWRFALWSFVGSALWTLVLALTGRLLARWPQAERWAGAFTLSLFAALILVYLVRLAKILRSRRQHRSGQTDSTGQAAAPV